MTTKTDGLKWIANALDPESATLSDMSWRCRPGQSHASALQEYKEFFRDKVIGEPKPVEGVTSQELRTMRTIGVYVKEPGG